jgi:hypothetical protein
MTDKELLQQAYGAFYTMPPKKEWVGLTYDDMIKIWNELYKGDDVLPTTFGMAIEAKLKEKNT